MCRVRQAGMLLRQRRRTSARTPKPAGSEGGEQEQEAAAEEPAHVSFGEGERNEYAEHAHGIDEPGHERGPVRKRSAGAGPLPVRFASALLLPHRPDRWLGGRAARSAGRFDPQIVIDHDAPKRKKKKEKKEKKRTKKKKEEEGRRKKEQKEQIATSPTDWLSVEPEGAEALPARAPARLPARCQLFPSFPGERRREQLLEPGRAFSTFGSLCSHCGCGSGSPGLHRGESAFGAGLSVSA
ncbi:hypothetical protein AXG93_1508s1090 [Marchantia polymorpha subsp. ruderalis]|uniref:Uncharacterized protein n=1 Tax=Marchantia polymorpha subsp. ruderalis TaxID=1480154 RepID=A0A176W9L5_MARPO|nr:hypothetical protein AXG93_1508s1090 [Marchantia polymorpha subsp. ruderalis]